MNGVQTCTVRLVPDRQTKQNTEVESHVNGRNRKEWHPLLPDVASEHFSAFDKTDDDKLLR